jgi:hypothetical protein
MKTRGVLVFPVSVLLCVFASPREMSAQGPVSVTQTFCLTTPCVWTYHNDNNRDGVNPNETTFTPTYFKTHSFTATTYPTDGLIYAQPLYIKALNGSNQKVGTCPSPADIVFAATENNSVYALQATPPPSLQPCWQLNLNQTGESAIPYTSLPGSCDNLMPQEGITGTPVIDVSVTPPILYVVSSHKTANGASAPYAQRLHAIDTTTGSELSGSPVDIGSQLGSNFIVIGQNQRPGLALSHPTGSPSLANIYISWASNCDTNPTGGFYDGWVAWFQMNYSSGTAPAFKGSFTSEPTGASHKGGVWMAGSAPAIDNTGNVYVAVANGDVSPPSQSSFEWGDSALKLSSSLAYQDFYTPNDWAELNGNQPNQAVCFVPTSGGQCPSGQTHTIATDTDMGTGGVVLLSNSELVSVGKQGMVYAIPYNTSNNGYMGGLDGGGYTSSSGSNPQNTACSTTTNFPTPGYIAQCFEAVTFNPNATSGVWGAPAFWSGGTQNQYLFTIGLNDYMYWYPYNSPTFGTASPVQSDHQFIHQGTSRSSGGMTSVTWNGTAANTGVAWALDSNGFGRYTNPGYQAAAQAVLYAYPAVPTNLTCNGGRVCELWDSTMLTNSSTVMPGAVKFTVPTIVDGYMIIAGGAPGYFGTGSSCDPVNFPACAGQVTILH